MTYDRSEIEQRLDDLEATLEDMPREIEERFKPYFQALEDSHKEDMENLDIRLETNLEIGIENLWTRLMRARRRP